MITIQLSDSIFVEVDNGDLFIYQYGYNRYEIKEMENNEAPPINEFTVEIISFHSRRHFRFKREGMKYWWYEIGF